MVNERPLADTSMSCEEATQQDDPMLVVRAFRSARLRGSGAEACLTKEALLGYCDVTGCSDLDWLRDPGPVCLYGCPDGELKQISWYSRESQPPTFKLRVERTPSGEATRVGNSTEAVTVGRGQPSTADGSEGLVIVEAGSSS